MEPWQERASPKDQCVLLAFMTGNRCKLKAIGNEARNGDANVAINGENALASPRKQQLAQLTTSLSTAITTLSVHRTPKTVPARENVINIAASTNCSH